METSRIVFYMCAFGAMINITEFKAAKKIPAL